MFSQIPSSRLSPFAAASASMAGEVASLEFARTTFPPWGTKGERKNQNDP